MFFIDSVQLSGFAACLHVWIVLVSKPKRRLKKLIIQIRIILAPFRRLTLASRDEVTKVLRRVAFKRQCEATIFAQAVPIIYKLWRGFWSMLKKSACYCRRQKASCMASFFYFLSMMASCSLLIFYSFCSILSSGWLIILLETLAGGLGTTEPKRTLVGRTWEELRVGGIKWLASLI